MEHTGEQIVELEKLELGLHEFDFQLDSEYLSSVEKSELLGGNIHATAQLQLGKNGFNLDMQVKGSVEITCDRCLEAMTQPIDASEQDIDIEQNAKTLDLKWLAYEMIVINLPLVHCHQPGGCNPQMDALLQSHLCCTEEEPEIL
ncbi:MAG: DUF177 domain-containing protein [Paludibacteraceae bacterium]|nr:DUF177 domain-containing protein [Paludibacteraceae bacterium]